MDAKTFQKPLAELANTLALKVEREGHEKLPQPDFVVVDIYMMLRQAHQTYDLFFYLNADERRKHDCYWKVSYSAVLLPLIRSVIDCLYNITTILHEPGLKGYQFRASGYKLALDAIEIDGRRYGGDPNWDAYLAQRRELLNSQMRANGLTAVEVRNAKTWPTFSRYFRDKASASLTPLEEFLKKFTLGFWQEYSGVAHATFQGLMQTAMFYTPSDVPFERRSQFEDITERMIGMYIGRVAAVLLCMLTEVQAWFRFDGAHINARLHSVWDALLPVPEIKELYDGRYAELMKSKGIFRD